MDRRVRIELVNKFLKKLKNSAIMKTKLRFGILNSSTIGKFKNRTILFNLIAGLYK